MSMISHKHVLKSCHLCDLIQHVNLDNTNKQMFQSCLLDILKTKRYFIFRFDDKFLLHIGFTESMINNLKNVSCMNEYNGNY